jgi:hypothetical protein
MAVKIICVLHFPTGLQLRDAENTRRLNSTVAAIRTGRKQTKRSVGPTRTLGILSIDLAIVVGGECFRRRYKVTKDRGERWKGVFLRFIYMFYRIGPSFCRTKPMVPISFVSS